MSSSQDVHKPTHLTQKTKTCKVSCRANGRHFETHRNWRARCAIFLVLFLYHCSLFVTDFTFCKDLEPNYNDGYLRYWLWSKFFGLKHGTLLADSFKLIREAWGLVEDTKNTEKVVVVCVCVCVLKMVNVLISVRNTINHCVMSRLKPLWSVWKSPSEFYVWDRRICFRVNISTSHHYN